MNFYIGMDGGGTKTKAVICDEKLNILHEETGGPSNFLLLGTEKVSETLLKLIQECKKKLDINYGDIASIVLGTTGAGRRNDAETLERAFIKYASDRGAVLPAFRVESDARIALEGAFSGKSGSILIAGTGSIMFGKDCSGQIHRVGGFGRFIGDEGSGYMIGRMGLIAVAKSYDGRGKHSLLQDMLKDRFSDPQLLITAVYKNNFDIASVTPLVVKAAEEGDEVCLRIIEEQSDELIAHILAMQECLGEKELRLCLIGSTITTDNFYASSFKAKIAAKCPMVKLQEANYQPAIGAVLMAMNLKKQ